MGDGWLSLQTSPLLTRQLSICPQPVQAPVTCSEPQPTPAALSPLAAHVLFRWRPTSCARIGVVNIDDGASVPQIPATSSAAAATPEVPSTPPRDNNWHNGGIETVEARENTQELPLISQCGGAMHAIMAWGYQLSRPDRLFNCFLGLLVTERLPDHAAGEPP